MWTCCNNSSSRRYFVFFGGKEPPLSLLSMPVASFVATGTACGRLRSRLAHKGCFLPPEPPILPPTRCFKRVQMTAQGRPPRRERAQPLRRKGIPAAPPIPYLSQHPEKNYGPGFPQGRPGPFTPGHISTSWSVSPLKKVKRPGRIKPLSLCASRLLPGAGGRSPARRGAWGERGKSPLHPLHPRTPLCRERVICLLSRAVPHPPRVAWGIGANLPGP